MGLLRQVCDKYPIHILAILKKLYLYHPEESKGGLHTLLPKINPYPSSMAALTASQLMNSPSPRRTTSRTQPGRYFLNVRIRAPTSSPPIVSPRRSLPAKYSRVSLIKHNTGRKPFLPRFFVLCPFRPPC